MQIKQKLSFFFGLTQIQPAKTKNTQKTDQPLLRATQITSSTGIQSAIFKKFEVGDMTSGDFELFRDQIQNGVYKPIPNISEIIPDLLEENKGYLVTRQIRVADIILKSTPLALIEEVSINENSLATYQITKMRGSQRLNLKSSISKSLDSQDVTVFSNPLIVSSSELRNINVFSASFYHRKKFDVLGESNQLEESHSAKFRYYFGDKKTDQCIS